MRNEVLGPGCVWCNKLEKEVKKIKDFLSARKDILFLRVKKIINELGLKEELLCTIENYINFLFHMATLVFRKLCFFTITWKNS